MGSRSRCSARSPQHREWPAAEHDDGISDDDDSDDDFLPEFSDNKNTLSIASEAGERADGGSVGTSTSEYSTTGAKAFPNSGGSDDKYLAVDKSEEEEAASDCGSESDENLELDVDCIFEGDGHYLSDSDSEPGAESDSDSEDEADEDEIDGHFADEADEDVDSDSDYSDDEEEEEREDGDDEPTENSGLGPNGIIMRVYGHMVEGSRWFQKARQRAAEME